MSVVGLKFEAAYGGGPLWQWNQYLWARHLARQSGEWRVAVQIVEPDGFDELASSALPFLDANGNLFELPIANRGFGSEEEREALLQAALSRLPGGPMVEPALRQMLPMVGHDLMTAARHCWHECLGAPSWQSGDESVKTPAELGQQRDLGLAKSWPQVVWVGPKQHRAMHELRLDPSDAIRGEEQLKELLLNRPPSQIPSLIKDLEQSLQDGLGNLSGPIREEAATLYGSFARLKRASRRALKDFQKSSERHFRNHKGIRGNRLRQLGQALRPGEQEQQFGLSLISAMALFHLQPALAVEQYDLFHGTKPQDTLLVNCETGIRSLISLSC